MSGEEEVGTSQQQSQQERLGPVDQRTYGEKLKAEFGKPNDEIQGGVASRSTLLKRQYNHDKNTRAGIYRKSHR